MRLPWPFRRSDPEVGVSASVADGAVQRLAAPVRHDWRAAGTLQPSFVGDPGIRVQRFPDEIAGSQLPPPILAPLGHARSADGPAGLVSGFARPTLAPVVPSAGGRAALPLRPGRSSRRLQRSVAGDAGAVDEARAPALAAVTQADVAPPTSVDLPATTDGVVDPLPVVEPRRIAVAATPTPPRTVSLTVARTPDLTFAPGRARVADMPVVERVVASGVPAAAIAVPGTAARTPTRTILRTSGGSRVRLGAPIQRSELAASLPSLDLAHPGSRATTAAPSTSVQRHPTATADEHAPAAGVGHATADAPLAGGLSTTIEDEPIGSTAGPLEVAPLIPGGLLLARVIANPEPVSPPAAVGAHGSAEPAAPAPAAPLVGSAPVGPMVSLRPTIPAPNSPPAPTASRTAAGSASRSAGPTGGRAALQRSAPPRPSMPGAPGVTRTAPQARVVSPDVPTRATAGFAPAAPSASSLVLARAAVPTVARANDQRPPMTVARPSGPGTIAVARPMTLLRDSTDVTATDDTVTEPARPAETAAGQGTAAMTPDGTPSGAAAATASSGSPAAPIAERDLDEMVRRLYPRLRRSLSSELLVARERAGTLADLR